MFEHIKIKMMKEYLFLEYPACSTCRKAKKWLDEQKVNYTDRHIVEERPTCEELKIWLRKFFNTSGLLYKSMQLKEKLDGMSEEKQLELLASDGKLVKRPLVIGEDFVLVGFKPEEWKTVLLK